MSDATIPIPDPVPLPAPAWLLWFLLQLTFVVHLIAMNVVLGGSVVTTVTWLRRRTDHDARLVEQLSRWLPVAVAATITFGVAPLLFTQVLYGRLLLTSSILLGWTWLAVVPIVTLAYYGAYLLAMKGGRLGAWEGPLRLVNLALWLSIAWVYASNMSLMLRPDTFLGKFLVDASGPRFVGDDASLLPRHLHVLVGAVAVAGLVVAASGLAQRSRDAAYAEWAMRRGMVWFGLATVLNLGLGTWFLVALPGETTMHFLGQSGLATALLGVGVLLGIVALGSALAGWQAPSPAPFLKASLGAIFLTLIAMVLVRDQVRQVALDAAGYRLPAWVAPQWGPIALFALLLVAALAAVAWMLVALARSAPAPMQD